MFHLDKVIPDIPSLAVGIPFTLWITLAAFSCGTLLAIPIALGRLSRHRLIADIGRIWTEFFLMTPPLVHIIWVYYVLPVVTGIRLSDLNSAILALAASTSAQMAETLRAAIAAIPKSQREAAHVLGLSRWQGFVYVTVPQAWRFALPPTCNTFASVMKDSSLAAVIAVPELMNRGQIVSTENFRPLEVLTIIAVLYFVLIYPFVLGGGLLEKWARSPYRTL